MEMVDQKRLDAKCSYKRFGLEMDAPGRELYKKAASVVRSRGMNMSPFRRVDNGTVTHDTWSRETAEAHAGIDTFTKIKDPEAREWNVATQSTKQSMPNSLRLRMISHVLHVSFCSYSLYIVAIDHTHLQLHSCVDFNGALCAKYDKDGNMKIEV
eukprot:scaffold2570_cov223-Alexandrium_tamarense.AAC.28